MIKELTITKEPIVLINGKELIEIMKKSDKFKQLFDIFPRLN